MPECLMLAYAEEMPRLKARRQLDAADVAIVTRVATQSQEGSKSFQQWVSATTREARRVIRDAGVVTLNGLAVSFDGLARGLGWAFGGGVDRE
jgi:hypothetical protein